MAHTAGMYARWSASLPLLTALITAGIALSSGCSSVVTGNAVKSGGPAPAAANAALLDPGNYPRRPRPPLGNVADDAAGHRVEAQRMADMVTGPWQIDDKLISPTNAEIAPTTAISDPGRLSVLVRGETIAPIATAHHFVAGFVSGRATPPPPKGQADSDNPKILDNGVLRFPTTQDAADAAAAMTFGPPDSPFRATRPRWPTLPPSQEALKPNRSPRTDPTCSSSSPAPKKAPPQPPT
nr:hypothetical protein [Mycobacterium nebraskense]